MGAGGDGVVLTGEERRKRWGPREEAHGEEDIDVTAIDVTAWSFAAAAAAEKDGG